MMLVGQILITIIISSLCLAVKIRRGEKDTMYGTNNCQGKSSCSCEASASTFMSRDGMRGSCQTPEMVGCEYADYESRQAFLFDEELSRVRISQGITKQSCRQIRRVYIWNLDKVSGNGIWIDITKYTKQYFTLDNEQKYPWDAVFSFVSKEKMKLFSGHLLKIALGDENCANCLIVKAKGNNSYPMNLVKFKSYFVKPSTKKNPSLISTQMTRVATTKMTIKVTMPTTKVPTKAVTTENRRTIRTDLPTTKVAIKTSKSIKTVKKKTLPYTQPKSITNVEDMQNTKSNIAATPNHPDNKNGGVSVTMTALISGVIAMLIVALFLLVLFCRRRYNSDSKFKSMEKLNHEVVGTSTKSRSWDWDGGKLLPGKSPSTSHSSRHYENFELETTKYDEITKEYDFDNYECIFGTKGKVASEDDDQLRSPEYAEIVPEYENYISLDSKKNSKGKKQKSRSSIKEKQSPQSPHQYTEIAVGDSDAVYDTFDKTYTTMQGQSLNGVHTPHQYTEIDIIDNNGKTTPNIHHEYSTTTQGEILCPPQYEEIDIGNDHSTKSFDSCNKQNLSTLESNENSKEYDSMLIDNEKSVIRSATPHEHQNSTINDKASNAEEFSNPCYEEHLMITPDTAGHNYENNPVNLSEHIR